MPHVELAVIGGGPAGVSAAAVAKKAGFHPVVFESRSVGASWRGHYDRLHLHTVRWLSNLPGLPFPKSEGKWVSRDGVITHLERYVDHFDLDVRTGIEVTHLERMPDGWLLTTSQGPVSAWAVVVATGYNKIPVDPRWPGQESFPGEFVLGAAYRSPLPYVGRDVLVVGPGNSGAEIATDLGETEGHGKIWLSYRTPPNITLREGPIPPPLMGIILKALRIPMESGDRFLAYMQRKSVGDLSEYGLPPAPRGIVTQMVRDDVIPVMDMGIIAMVKDRTVKPVPAVIRIEGKEVLLADGSRIAPDVIVACVGYRRGLEPLVGHLGVLDTTGKPVVVGGAESPTAPRLYFAGLDPVTTGLFRQFGIEAKGIARSLRRARRTSRIRIPA
ncbi:MAG TPA: NAD(P)/FAD-dependent oxidoreductase [Pseudolysinimonas sp.]|nr:NAD(P)/FAD-dependent oxidoreductase [Pseudolysinimonas sp.]